MEKTILTQRQQKLLDALSEENYIRQNFYLSGGTIAQQLLTARGIKDYPRMLIPFDYNKCEKFWLKEAQNLEKDILK